MDRRGFTLVELLAVLIVLALLAATFVPYALARREEARRVRCADNLRAIGEAFAAYHRDNGYAYPRTRADAALGGAWQAFTGPDDPNPFDDAPGGVAANDVTASLWLLVRGGLAEPKRFLCPSAGGRPADPRTPGNFRDPSNLGYAYATPFGGPVDYRLNDTLPAQFAILADRPPDYAGFGSLIIPGKKPKLYRPFNSPNHAGAGQNVRYSQGNVEWVTTPYVGRDPPDLIYASRDGGPGPADKHDAVLVPPAGYRPR